MTRTVFNNNFNLGNVESFKFLPDELQDCIGEYVEEAINIKNNNDYNWNNIIYEIGSEYGFGFLIQLINELLSDDCKNSIGYSHKCEAFITCEEKLSVGFYYENINKCRHQYFWEDDGVSLSRATELIVKKIDDYIESDNYDPSIMFQINKKMLFWYNTLAFVSKDHDHRETIFCV